MSLGDELSKDEAAENILYAFTKAFRNYFNFKGRTCRYDYWGFGLVNSIIAILFGFMGGAIPSAYSLLTFIPGLAVFSRRLHDTGRSFLKWGIIPWGLLFIASLMLGLLGFHKEELTIIVALLVVVYVITLLVICCQKGESESNEYGEPVIEDKKHDEKVKWIIFFFILIPVLGVITRGVAGYDRAMQRMKNQQIQSEININQKQEANVQDNESKPKVDMVSEEVM